MRYFILSILAVSIFMPSYVTAHEHEGAEKHDAAEANAEAETVSDTSVIKLTDSIYMIQVGGGNIALSLGDQGVFMIDNGLADNKDKVMNAIKGLTDKPVKILVNTHWHYDHAGNNESFGDQDTIIIAQENVRKRLKEGGTIAAFDKIIEPAAVKALPVLTYDDEIKVHLNGSAAHIIKIDPAHTDGDSIIFWPEENILHTGDLFFNGFFPFIDVSSGGNLKGMIAAADKMLGMVNETTKIIPGHGPLGNKSDLEAYSKMLKTIAERVKTFKETNQTKEQWIAKNPLIDMDEEWGDGFLPNEKFTNIIWDAY